MRAALCLLLTLPFLGAVPAHAQLDILGPMFPKARPAPTDRFPGEPKVAKTERESLGTALQGWSHDPQTADCGCKYQTQRGVLPAGTVLSGSCGYVPRVPTGARPMARWTRVLPLEQLALGRSCSAGANACHDASGQAVYGAACCMMIDPQFQRMTRDAWDWVPMIAEISTDRNDKRFTAVLNGVEPYGSCKFRISPQAGTVEPADRSKGVIARILLYFHDVWNVPMTPSQVALYNEWSRMAPPSQDEQARARVVDSLQQMDNPYYSKAAP